MELSRRCFLAALKAALRGQSAQVEEELSPEEWWDVFQLAREHNVLPMIYDAVHSLPSLKDKPFLPMLRPQVLQLVMLQTMKSRDFLDLNRHLQQAGEKPVIVKGIICRSLYPNPDYRMSGDEDMLIQPERFDTCHEAMLSFGMEPADQTANMQEDYEVPYGKQGSPIYIELHKHLFPPEQEAYGDLNRFFVEITQRAVPVEVQGETVYTMPPTDHLFYLICHAYKHFLHSGFGLRQVCDVCMFAEHYGSEICWDQVLEQCREIRADRFAAAMFRIGENHLGIDLDKAQYPSCWQEMTVDEMPMLEDLLQSGVFGASDMSRKHSSTITLSAVASQKQGKKQSGVLKSLFPSAKALEKRYPYLEKYPWLLPAAWCSRIAKYGTETRQGKNNNAVDALKIGSQRVELFKQYGILD